MPEALAGYLESGRDLEIASKVQASIVQTYRDDFPKYSKKVQSQYLRQVFNYIPATVGEKLVFSKINSNVRASVLKEALQLVVLAQLVTFVQQTAANGVPLGAEVDQAKFKTYFLDCGLMCKMNGLSMPALESFLSLRFVNSGKLAEQFVAQQFLQCSPSYERPALYYWMREGKTNNAEVDFVVAVGDRVVPVEVKAGESGSLRSLLVFAAQKKTDVALRFDTNVPSMQEVSAKTTDKSGQQVNYRLLSLPLYMAGEASRILGRL